MVVLRASKPAPRPGELRTQRGSRAGPATPHVTPRYSARSPQQHPRPRWKRTSGHRRLLPAREKNQRRATGSEDPRNRLPANARHLARAHAQRHKTSALRPARCQCFERERNGSRLSGPCQPLAPCVWVASSTMRANHASQSSGDRRCTDTGLGSDASGQRPRVRVPAVSAPFWRPRSCGLAQRSTRGSLSRVGPRSLPSVGMPCAPL
jgi:hypothetical protein